jgi:hypothetical protein
MVQPEGVVRRLYEINHPGDQGISYNNRRRMGELGSRGGLIASVAIVLIVSPGVAVARGFPS